MEKSINEKYMELIHENEMTATIKSYLEEIRIEQYVISDIGNKFVKLFDEISSRNNLVLEDEIKKIMDKYKDLIDIDSLNSLEYIFDDISKNLDYRFKNINIIKETNMDYRVEIYDSKKYSYTLILYYIKEEEYADRIKYSLNYSLSKDKEPDGCVINTVDIFIGSLELENSEFTGSQLEIVSSSDINHYIIVSELESIQMDFKKMKDIYMHLYKEILEKML